MIDGPVVLQTDWFADWYCKSTGATFHVVTAEETSLGYFYGSLFDKVGYYPRLSRLLKYVVPTIRWFCNPQGPNEEVCFNQIPSKRILPSPCRVVPPGWKSKRSGTVIVNLKEPLYFSKQVRYCLRKAKDVHVEQPINTGYYLDEMFKCKKPFPNIEDYLGGMYRNGGFLLGASISGNLVTGLGVRVALGWAQEVWSWSTLEGYSNYAQDALHYHAINLCREKGYDVFDLANVDPLAKPGTKAFGIKQFKQKWGTYIERPLIWR